MLSKEVRMSSLLIFLILSILALSGCSLPAAVEPAETEEEKEATTESTDGDIEAEEIGPTLEPTSDLAPEPVAHTFQASDGVELQGMFYPARTDDQPLIVMMHWVQGDMDDWRIIASWLQNGDIQEDVVGSGMAWLESAWFPAVPEGVSFNVFTFTFRDCEGGCQAIDPEGWQLDIEAAMMYIKGLPNVDLSRVATVGASIGADSAAYGCYYYNVEYGVCHGALSISPGGYVKSDYSEAVFNLEDESPPASAWCLYAVGDAEAAASCQDTTGDLYQATEYEGSAHGMMLISPDSDPNPMGKLLEFLNTIGICEACSVE